MILLALDRNNLWFLFFFGFLYKYIYIYLYSANENQTSSERDSDRELSRFELIPSPYLSKQWTAIEGIFRERWFVLVLFSFLLSAPLVTQDPLVVSYLLSWRTTSLPGSSKAPWLPINFRIFPLYRYRPIEERRGTSDK